MAYENQAILPMKISGAESSELMSSFGRANQQKKK
jgi:hypothetical protein